MERLRKIIKIDEEKCDGCGQCVPACVEGAIQIIDRKARLVSEQYCDGLGACLGECPQGAITIEERVAEEFDERAVEWHLAKDVVDEASPYPGAARVAGCPGAVAFALDQPAPHQPVALSPSRLGNWPVQLRLVPVQARYLHGARLLIAADCVPFALGDFHQRFLAGHVLLVGCPKLDDADFYRNKLSQIFATNDIQSVDVLHMEVPCCFGLVRLVQLALEDSGKQIPLKVTKIGIGGEILENSRSANEEELDHAQVPRAGHSILEA